MLTQSRIDHVAIARDFAGRHDDWPLAPRFDPRQRWYHRLATTDQYEVWLLTWLPGQGTDLHDHGGCAGALVRSRLRRLTPHEAHRAQAGGAVLVDIRRLTERVGASGLTVDSGSGFDRSAPPTIATAEAPVDASAVRIFPEMRSVQAGPEDVELTKLEYDLMLFLAEHPRTVFTRRQLLQGVWATCTRGNGPSTSTSDGSARRCARTWSSPSAGSVTASPTTPGSGSSGPSAKGIRHEQRGPSSPPARGPRISEDRAATVIGLARTGRTCRWMALA
jgi:hypothetical protein